MLETIRQDYIRTIRAKGLPERVVIFKHALKNAFPPILNITGLSAFSWEAPSLQSDFFLAWDRLAALRFIAARDYPMVQGFVLLTSLCFVLVNFGIDILTTYIDPRVTLG